MDLSRYEFNEKNIKESLTDFEFISEGYRGKIQKLIRFSESSIKGIFYFEFGDVIMETKEIDETIVSNNGDRKKIYATFRAAIYAFTEHKPEVWVYATGNTKAKTRLIRMEITNYYDELKKDFIILGLRNDVWENFQKNVDFTAYIWKRKGSLPEIPNPAFLSLIHNHITQQSNSN